MGAYTQGPWEVRKSGGEYRVHAADSFEHGYVVEMRIVEDVGGYRHPQEDGSWSDAEVLANARLISSAPELLEACERLKGVYGRPSAKRTRAEAWRALDAAIAKAKGGRDE